MATNPVENFRARLNRVWLELNNYQIYARIIAKFWSAVFDQGLRVKVVTALDAFKLMFVSHFYPLLDQLHGE